MTESLHHLHRRRHRPSTPGTSEQANCSNPELCINFSGKLRTVLLISDFSERRAASVSITVHRAGQMDQVCSRFINSIALLDPFTLRDCFLDADQYWRTSFQSLLTSRQCSSCSCVRFWQERHNFNIKTHVGHLLNPGDYALGCELYEANSDDMELDKYKGHILEAILIKKRVPAIRGGIGDCGDELPSVPLDELLADLDLSEDEDEEDNMTE
ncbi:hypothetical protein V8G54_003370 [Vigna mungo]|uniref:60S ribosomal export protein NMD3 OB-fold domain-containing protein n=1 Tax=Vigna mungo TaxID=3915 RepID=A0AAQ3SDQ8_VIGMU